MVGRPWRTGLRQFTRFQLSQEVTHFVGRERLSGPNGRMTGH